MRFVERTIMGLRYHRQMNILIALISAVFTMIGLFLRTNIKRTSQSAANFSQQVNQLPGGQENTSANSVLSARTMQATYYSMAFWATVAVYLILLLIIAAIYIRRQQQETAAYIGAGKRLSDVAGQSAAEGALSATAGFGIVAILVSLFDTQIVNWWTKIDQQLFAHVMASPNKPAHSKVVAGIQSALKNRMTDYNAQSLIFGDNGVGNQLPAAVSGFLFVGVIAIMAVIIVNFIVMVAQARTVRSHLS